MAWAGLFPSIGGISTTVSFFGNTYPEWALQLISRLILAGIHQNKLILISLFVSYLM
jgi:hypothetical protein